MSVKHTDHTLVTAARITATPRSGQTVSGYGGRIPTRYQLRYQGRWHRVYMMQYGNAGSAYLRKAGDDLFLDIDTEYELTGQIQGVGTPTPTTKNGEHCAEHAENGTCIHSDHTA